MLGLMVLLLVLVLVLLQECRGEQGSGWRDLRKREMHGGKNTDGAVPADGAVLVLLAQ